MPATTRERVSRLEETLNRFILHTDQSLYRLGQEMKDFKDGVKDFQDEMKDFKDEMKDFKDEMRLDSKQFRRDMNKKWGDLANKMGTIVEDIISPAIRPIIEKYFKEKVDYIAIHIRKKIKKDNLQGEFDVIATTNSYFFLTETKSSPSKEYLNNFKQFVISRFRELFPEYKKKQLIPFFASLRFEESFIELANQEQVYLLAYREWDYMDLLNYDALQGDKAN